MIDIPPAAAPAPATPDAAFRDLMAVLVQLRTTAVVFAVFRGSSVLAIHARSDHPHHLARIAGEASPVRSAPTTSVRRPRVAKEPA